MSMKPGRTGISRIVAATFYSWKGFRAAFKHEAAFRQELGLAVVALPLAYLLSRDVIQFLLLALPLLLILLVIRSNYKAAEDLGHVLKLPNFLDR